MGYVPDGMTPEQYKRLKQKEKETNSKKKFGAFGPQSFKSRSMQSFQTDLESGKADHLMPVLNAKARVKAGKIKESDIPYMQRLGSWDDSDLGKKKKKWSSLDKKYQQDARPTNLDWSGRNPRQGPQQRTAATSKKQAPPPNKKLFGLF